MTYEERKKQLLDLNQQLWSEWDNLEVVVDNPDRNYIAKVKTDSDGPVTLLSHIKADGLTWEKFKPFIDNPSSIDALYQNKVTTVLLDGETTLTSSSLFQGKAKMPTLISNRSTIFFGYEVKEDVPNGWHYVFGSSQGTEALAEQHKDKIGSDVLAYMHINMVMFREYEGGIELKQTGKYDLKGWLPIAI